MLSKKFITFGKPNVGKKEIYAVNKVIKSYWLGTGKITQDFEKNFQDIKK